MTWAPAFLSPRRDEKSWRCSPLHRLRTIIKCPDDFIGKELEIAGSELTNPEAAKVLGRVLGRPVKFQKLPLPLVRLVLGKEFYLMFRWFNEAGFKADIPGLRRKYPEVHLHTLEEWLREEGWHKRAKRVRAPKE